MLKSVSAAWDDTRLAAAADAMFALRRTVAALAAAARRDTATDVAAVAAAVQLLGTLKSVGLPRAMEDAAWALHTLLNLLHDMMPCGF